MGELNSITQVALPDGQVINIVDWTDTPLYSTCDILSGATDTSLDLFTYVVADPVVSSSNIVSKRTATERDTNLSTPGGMSSSEEMLVYSIRVEYSQWYVDATTSQDASTAVPSQPGYPLVDAQVMAIMQQQCILKLNISEKVYSQMGLGYYNTGFGAMVSGGSSDVANAERYWASAGLPSADAVRTFVIPNHIGAQEKYHVSIFNPDGSTYTFRDADGGTTGASRKLVRLRVILDGLYKRPVS